MPALRMKEPLKPASIATKRKLEDQIRRLPTSCTRPEAAEMARSWKTGFKPKSTSQGMPQTPAQHKAARHRVHLAWLRAQQQGGIS